MNHTLTLRPPAPLRIGPVLILIIALCLASAVSLAPTLARTARPASHSEVCKCAHCPGGLAGCCRSGSKCEGQ
jgi:hypothetical protein